MKVEMENFDTLVRKVMSVSKEEILRREAEYRRGVDANENRRGPKRKPKLSSASHAPAAS